MEFILSLYSLYSIQKKNELLHDDPRWFFPFNEDLKNPVGQKSFRACSAKKGRVKPNKGKRISKMRSLIRINFR